MRSSWEPAREGKTGGGTPTPLKILHTSDLHLDSRFVGIADRSLRARRRRDHRDVVLRIVDLAEEEDVDLILFVGDLFEESTYQFETISYLVEEFRRFHPKPVFIAPGLSDSFHSLSPYAIFDWGENVHIFERPAFTSVTIPRLGVTVHGSAPDRDHLEANPLRGLVPKGDGTIEIGMVYGSNLDRCPEGAGRPFPFREQDVRGLGVHYLALGGYHSFQKFGKRPPACYPGMPEGTGFREAGEKVVVLATLDGEKVSIHRRHAAGLIFDEVSVDLGGLSTADALIRLVEEVVSSKDRPNSIIRVRLGGRPDPSLPIDVHDLAERIHLEHGKIDIVDETRDLPDWREVGKGRTLAGEFVRAIQKKVERNESARYEKVRDYGLGALLGKGDLRLGKPPPS